jgi:hypothetical protein
MTNFKKKLSALLTAALLCATFVGCGGGQTSTTENGNQNSATENTDNSGNTESGDNTDNSNANPTPDNNGMGNPDNGMDMPNNGMGNPDNGMTMPDNGMGTPDNGMGTPDNGMGTPDNGMTMPDNGTTPPDNSANGGFSDVTDTTTSSDLANNALSVIGGTYTAVTEVPTDASRITEKVKITTGGNYFVEGDISGNKINIACEGVTLYLKNATLSNEKKVIESDYDLTIILIGENTVTNSNADGSNAIDCAGNLVINGGGSLTVNATKNGIKANSITILGSTLNITSSNDGLHAEVTSYDDATQAPTPSYEDGGYVYINGANLTINSGDDGIQADTFALLAGEGEVNITSTGKGIKAGAIDWGTSDTSLDWTGYLVYIKSGNITIVSTDDAIHSNGDTIIEGGNLTLTSGDDGVHADNTLDIADGTINITKCYEGLEGSVVNISGGNITLLATDDGINAAGGKDNSGFGGNDAGGWGFGFGGMMGGGFGGMGGNMGNMGGSSSTSTEYYISISGGVINITAAGDGVDSNGNLYISGGELYISGPVSSADAPIDYDGTATITGGIVVAVGSSGMAQNFGSSSTQGSILMTYSSNSKGDVTLTDSNGNTLASFSPLKSYNSVVVSCPQLTVGSTYTLSACGKSSSITLSSLIYGGSSNGMGGNMGGGNMGGGRI